MSTTVAVAQPKKMWGQPPSTVLNDDLGATAKARRERRRALIVPREHGAWGLLLVPMITGAGVAFRQSFHVLPFLLLLTGALALFCLRTPVESLLGTSAMRAQTKDERQTLAAAVGALGAVAAIALGSLLWAGHNPYLWLIGLGAGICFAAQSLLKLKSTSKLMWRQLPRLSRETLPRASAASPGGKAEWPRSRHSTRQLRMLSEVVGTIGLTASAPSAYYVITGKLGLTAWVLWLANLLFAGDQIHYVQLRLHTVRIAGLRAKLAQGWSFAVGQAALTVVLTLAGIAGLMPEFASLAFAPLLFRGWFYFIQKPAPLLVRRLGWSELSHAVAFCILFIAVFVLPR